MKINSPINRGLDHLYRTVSHSIRRFIIECKKITDARMFNQIANKEIRIRAKLSQQVVKFMDDLNLTLPH